MDITHQTPEIDFDEFFARVERRYNPFADGQLDLDLIQFAETIAEMEVPYLYQSVAEWREGDQLEALVAYCACVQWAGAIDEHLAAGSDGRAWFDTLQEAYELVMALCSAVTLGLEAIEAAVADAEQGEVVEFVDMCFWVIAEMPLWDWDRLTRRLIDL